MGRIAAAEAMMNERLKLKSTHGELSVRLWVLIAARLSVGRQPHFTSPEYEEDTRVVNLASACWRKAFFATEHQNSNRRPPAHSLAPKRDIYFDRQSTSAR